MGRTFHLDIGLRK